MRRYLLIGIPHMALDKYNPDLLCMVVLNRLFHNIRVIPALFATSVLSTNQHFPYLCLRLEKYKFNLKNSSRFYLGVKAEKFEKRQVFHKINIPLNTSMALLRG